MGQFLCGGDENIPTISTGTSLGTTTVGKPVRDRPFLVATILNLAPWLLTMHATPQVRLIIRFVLTYIIISIGSDVCYYLRANGKPHNFSLVFLIMLVTCYMLATGNTITIACA